MLAIRLNMSPVGPTLGLKKMKSDHMETLVKNWEYDEDIIADLPKEKNPLSLWSAKVA